MNVSKKLFSSVLCFSLLMSYQPTKASTGRTLFSITGYAASFALLLEGMEMSFRAGMSGQKDGLGSIGHAIQTPLSFCLLIGSVACASLATYIWASEGKEKEKPRLVEYVRRNKYDDDEDTLHSSRKEHRKR